MYLGIDVAAACLHCVAIRDDGSIALAHLVDADEIETFARDCVEAEVVAIDAPSDTSTRPHVNDDASTLSEKFRLARCAELCLGREHRIWVPFIAPPERPETGWLATGFRSFAAFRAVGIHAIEVFPHAAYRALRGSPLPPKRSARGIRARIEALVARGIPQDSLEMWSHDGLDALVAAVVARDHAKGHAVKVTCGHDESAIWLPATAVSCPISPGLVRS